MDESEEKMWCNECGDEYFSEDWAASHDYDEGHFVCPECGAIDSYTDIHS